MAPRTPKKSTGGQASVAAAQNTLADLWRAYLSETPPSRRCLPLFLRRDGRPAFHLLRLRHFISLQCLPGIVRAASIMAGDVHSFASTVGQFVLLASLRIQANPANKSVFREITPERAFAEFVFSSIVLHAFVFSFLG